MTRVNGEPAGLLSIGEFAKRSALSVTALRFYADCGLLVPARIDSATGYRYYAPGQLREAALLRHLRGLEMPISEIQPFLTSERSDAQAMLDLHWTRLERRFDGSRRAFAAVQTLLGSKEELVPATTTLDGSELARGLRQVLPAAGPIGQDRRYPAAVLVDLREDGVRLVATDGHRLIVRDIPASTVDLGQTAISAADARRVASIVEDGGPVTETAGAELAVRTSNETVSIAAASDHYPDYEAVLARCGNARLLVETADLAARLNRASELVVLKLTASEIFADSIEFPAKYEGDELTIGFNPAFLADALEAGIGPETILQLGSPLDPVAIRSADDGTLTCLVMPIRLLEKATA
ncbi:MAG TPA: MerR family transcriptional regulator [Candidatus Dormibacteraeota bacterium]|jgi:DNA-binding transcriptional MerR regulator